MLDLYKTFARYNRWANATLYAACDRLGDGAYYADRRAFFGSIHNTLNHLVVTDRIWLARIEGRPNPPYALNDVPYAGRAELRAARAAEDDRLIAVVEAIDPARRASPSARRCISCCRTCSTTRRTTGPRCTTC